MKQETNLEVTERRRLAKIQSAARTKFRHENDFTAMFARNLAIFGEAGQRNLVTNGVATRETLDNLLAGNLTGVNGEELAKVAKAIGLVLVPVEYVRLD